MTVVGTSPSRTNRRHRGWSGGQSARRSSELPYDALDLVAALQRMVGIPSFLSEDRIDLGRRHAGTAQIDAQLEERLVALTGRCDAPPVDRCGLTLCPIVAKFPRFLFGQQFAHPSKSGAIGRRHRSLLQWHDRRADRRYGFRRQSAMVGSIASPDVRIERQTARRVVVDEEAVGGVPRLTRQIKQAGWGQFAHIESMAQTRLDPIIGLKLLLRPVASTVHRPHDLLADGAVCSDRHSDGRGYKHPPPWRRRDAAVAVDDDHAQARKQPSELFVRQITAVVVEPDAPDRPDVREAPAGLVGQRGIEDGRTDQPVRLLALIRELMPPAQAVVPLSPGRSGALSDLLPRPDRAPSVAPT